MLREKLEKIIEIDWKLLCKRVYHKSKSIDISIHAMSLVYTTLLSIIPLLIFSFYIMTLFNFFGGMDRIVEGMKEFILSHLATGTGQTLVNLLESYISDIDVAQLGVISFISLVAVIIYMLTRIEKTFNLIWGVKEHRDFFKRFVAFWTFITLGTLFITVSLSLTISVITSYASDSMISLSFSDTFMLRFISTLSYFLFYIVGYYLIPNTKVDPLAAIIGGSISGVLFTLARVFYTMYTKNVVAYYRIRRIYGSLSVAPLFLIWLYVVWSITLFGAVISYVFHHRASLNYLESSKDVKAGIYDFVPVAVLIILYKSFSSGYSQGVEFKGIAEKINLPVEIIRDKLQKMKKNKLIAETEDGKFIPTTTIENISLLSVCDSLVLANGMEIDDIFVDKEMVVVYNHLKQGLEDNLRDITIKDIVAEEV